MPALGFLSSGEGLLRQCGKPPTIKDACDALVAEALRLAGDNQKPASALLGISRKALNGGLMEPNNAAAPAPGRVYLCAPVNALVEGIYEEKIPLSQVKRHGDFGLGTFDALDGEMVMLDGQIFRVTGDGRVHEVDERECTPFACVTFYQPLSHDELNAELSYTAFKEWLEGLLPSPNIFYAIRVEGRFASMRVRSVPKQENYRPLVQVAEEQPVFTFTDIEGSVVGFFTPAFVGSINVPGLHLHFLSADRQRGGHLLECRPNRVRAGIQMMSTLELALPMSFEYLTWDFHRDTKQDLEKAEK